MNPNVYQDDVLYAHEFLVTFLSIIAITDELSCYIAFHRFFHDLKMGKFICMGCENDNDIYILVRDKHPSCVRYLTSITKSLSLTFLSWSPWNVLEKKGNS